MSWLWVALGGALGASLRYGLTVWLAAWTRWPLGTLSANILGSCLLGAFMTWWLPRMALVGEPLRLFVAIGLLGGFTTFSTFSYDTLMLASSGRVGAALGNVLLNLFGALGGVSLGWIVTRYWAGGMGPV